MIPIPLGDVDRRPVRFPVVTALIVVVNVLVFLVELAQGPSFIRRWSVLPSEIMSGRHLITILTAMFMHAGFLHILGNMIFLWAFGPEMEDSMGPGRYAVFYLMGGTVAFLAQCAMSLTPASRALARAAQSRR